MGDKNIIIVTGAAGFIGSGLVSRLNELGHYYNIIVVDEFGDKYKDRNLKYKFIHDWIDRELFLNTIDKFGSAIDFVFHIGARTDTTETGIEIFNHLNLEYSKKIWNFCTINKIPLIYASSAATYGNGELGYQDDIKLLPSLKPLNPYGQSKQDFDVWVTQQKSSPPFWAGFKFFNVYGPNEYHKSRMASVVLHAFKQIKKTGTVQLFRSHKEGILDGHQSRDFVYVKDLIDVLLFFYSNRKHSGIYNLGSGIARPFIDLVNGVFNSVDKVPNVTFIDTPIDIRDTYQYFTQADISKLRRAGYVKEFTTLEEGIDDYVTNYLRKDEYL